MSEQEQLMCDTHNKQFAHDVQKGLSQERKYIPSKYFYDEKGSALFNKITHHPDYYLTNCELEIIENNKAELSALLQNEDCNVIELGPGEGIKTLILLKQLLKDSRQFSYYMIDISLTYLNYLTLTFLNSLPQLKIHSICKDFSDGLNSSNLKSDKKNIVLFLGSSIGNLNKIETLRFLSTIWSNLNNGDYILIGFDLKKDMKVMCNAYDDKAQLTKAFNLNLLERMNRELKANFQLSNFTHYPTYNVYSGAMESYLISIKPQTIYCECLNHRFHFDAFESIHVECSYKYNLSQIDEFARACHFKVVKNFTDSKNYFTLSLWVVEKNESID